ncbi:MAG: DUF6488 family protein [Deferrisomatales bacterium]|nr:DUF6488 family protein [Deferrisomatales bacterium]
MRTLYITVFALIVSLTTVAYAGPGGAGHSHGAPISGEQAAVNAAKVVEYLADKGKIDPTWREVGANEAQQKKQAKGTEWVVSFDNPKITDPEKKTLYVFLTLQGDYVAANYTGT